MSETELAQKFIAYFEGYEIYQEVPGAGIIDFVAALGNIRIAVEVKTTFNWKVFEQAVKNLNYANYSYIAVPATKDSYFRERLCKNYGVGLLFLGQGDYVTEVVKPKLQRKHCGIKLQEYMKRSVAGSQNARITAFGNTVEAITFFLRRAGGKVTVKRVMEEVKHHYSTNSSARSSIINMCRAGVIKDFVYENGFLKLPEPK